MTSPFPWLYPYAPEDLPRLGRDVLRPVLPISVVATENIAPRLGLVDTGSEHVLAAAWVADLAVVDLAAAAETLRIGIGGQIVEVVFVEVELRLHAPDEAEEFISWRTDVGFVPGWQAPFPLVLGQTGFLDRFTMTFHRGAAMLAVEEWETFDTRFLAGRPD